MVRDGENIYLTRSLDRPLLVVAERIDSIRDWLESRGIAASSKRPIAVWLRHTTSPGSVYSDAPTYRRFFKRPRSTLPNDLDLIGRRYVEASVTTIEPRVILQIRRPWPPQILCYAVAQAENNALIYARSRYSAPSRIVRPNGCNGPVVLTDLFHLGSISSSESF